MLNTKDVTNYLAKVVPKPGQIRELPLEQKLIQTGFGPADLRVVASNLARTEEENTDNVRILNVYVMSPDRSHSAHLSIGNEGRYKGVRFQQVNHNAFVRGTYNSSNAYEDGLWKPLTYEHINLREISEPEIFEKIKPEDKQNGLDLDTLSGPTETVPDTDLTFNERLKACTTYEELIKFVQGLIALHISE